jgi:hypothetical protein
MYINKYLKYKDKYLKYQNLNGGSAHRISTHTPSTECINFRITIMSHDDISRLCSKKIVATPHSGGEPKKLYNMWLNLDENSRKCLINIYFKQYGWTLGVFISDKQTRVANIIIFYIVEYLDLLARITDKTLEELLNIFEEVQDENKFNKDLIKIAFGDIFNMGHNDNPLETEEGNLVLAKYISLI